MKITMPMKLGLLLLSTSKFANSLEQIVETNADLQLTQEYHEIIRGNGPVWQSHDDTMYTSPSTSWWPGFQHRHFSGWDMLISQAREQLKENSPENSIDGSKGLKSWTNHKIVKSHHMIPMRDGTRLSTIVLRLEPKQRSHLRPVVERRPALLSRSPYGPTSDQVADLFMMSNGMVAVIQDQRGTFLSKGEFSLWADDATDGYDTMEWISQQSWSNGEVYTAGISADGCGAFTQLLSKPKWLKGQFLMLASATGYETMYPGGAFREGLVEGWMSLMAGFTHGKSLTKTLPAIKHHEAKSTFYDTIEATGHYSNVKWPSVHLASWWDIFQIYHIKAWEGYATHSHPSVRKNHSLFVSPLGHCMLHTAVGMAIPVWSRKKDEMFHEDLIVHEAKGWINAFGLASEVFAGKSTGHFHDRVGRVNLFIQGPMHDRLQPRKTGNYWTSLNDWPKANIQRFTLTGNEQRNAAPSPQLLAAHPECGCSHEKASYRYDPKHPVVTRGGNNLILAFIPGPYSCGSQDQTASELGHRQGKDLVSFTSQAPLSEPMAVVGQIKAILYVSSNRNDTDFTATLSDVYPDGRSMLVRYGIQRMKWRDQPTKESPPMSSGKVYQVEIDLWATAYIFDVGHRLRVTITSSDSPFYLTNPNDDKTIEQEEEAQRTSPRFPRQTPGLTAENSIHFSSLHPSHIKLPVVDMNSIPKNERF